MVAFFARCARWGNVPCVGAPWAILERKSRARGVAVDPVNSRKPKLRCLRRAPSHLHKLTLSMEANILSESPEVPELLLSAAAVAARISRSPDAVLRRIKHAELNPDFIVELAGSRSFFAFQPGRVPEIAGLFERNGETLTAV